MSYFELQRLVKGNHPGEEAMIDFCYVTFTVHTKSSDMWWVFHTKLPLKIKTHLKHYFWMMDSDECCTGFNMLITALMRAVHYTL